MFRNTVVILALLAVAATAIHIGGVPPKTLPVNIVDVSAYNQLKTSNESVLYSMTTTAAPNNYSTQPYLLKLKGSRFQVGYDYANLMAEQTSFTYTTFLDNVASGNNKTVELLGNFTDYLFEKFYASHVPQRFLTELTGMKTWCADQPTRCANLEVAPEVVSRRFYALANMPADAPNIIAGLLYEFDHTWPDWLASLVNAVIDTLDGCRDCTKRTGFIHKCDSYGVWGSRTENGRLYTSRNLDYNPNTGINRYKLLTVFDIAESGSKKQYATYGFSFGLGALAGQSANGITTSEMNLDNGAVTFSGIPFPLRLRYVLEDATDLQSAMTLWNATNNTNSFNFLIGSANDGQAYALETKRGFTGVFPANSPIEAAAQYPCGVPPNEDPTCSSWANGQTGNVLIGKPLPEAVWRSNHGMNPNIMATQEPLFHGTIYRYNLMHDLFVEYKNASVPIADEDAVRIVATLGIKGNSFFTCDQKLDGTNVLSVAYVPGEKRVFVAWEDGSGSAWRPAACAEYLHVNLTQWWS